MWQLTPTDGGVGPEQLFDVWPVLVRAGWFAAGFVVTVVVGFYVVVPTVARLVRRRNQNNRTLHEAVSRYVQVLILVLGVYVGAAIAGYTRFVTSSALVVAALTLAIGVAAQSVVGSLVSGLVLVVDPEFNIGDYIAWGDREGTIRTITLRVTRVQTVTGELVTIPNTVLTREAVSRPYGHGRYQVVERVTIDYEDDVDEALELLEAVATDLDRVIEAPSPCAYVDGFAEGGVVLRVHFWIAGADRRVELAVRSAFARAVMDRFETAGITINPASTVELIGQVETTGGARN